MVGKLSTVSLASVLKVRSKRELESEPSKPEVLLFPFVASTILKASVAGHAGSMLYEVNVFAVMLLQLYKFMTGLQSWFLQGFDGFLLICGSDGLLFRAQNRTTRNYAELKIPRSDCTKYVNFCHSIRR